MCRIRTREDSLSKCNRISKHFHLWHFFDKNKKWIHVTLSIARVWWEGLFVCHKWRIDEIFCLKKEHTESVVCMDVRCVPTLWTTDWVLLLEVQLFRFPFQSDTVGFLHSHTPYTSSLTEIQIEMNRVNQSLFSETKEFKRIIKVPEVWFLVEWFEFCRIHSVVDSWKFLQWVLKYVDLIDVQSIQVKNVF